MYLNIAFTILYMIEAGLKFIALRLVSFFSVMYLVLLVVSRGTKQVRARVLGKPSYPVTEDYPQVGFLGEEVSFSDSHIHTAFTQAPKHV